MDRKTQNENSSFLEEDHSQNILRGCCRGVRTDRRLIIISSQIGFSTLTLLFAFMMVVKKKEDEDSGIFMTLISSILSFWLGKATEF
jgi:hypothetical protein